MNKKAMLLPIIGLFSLVGSCLAQPQSLSNKNVTFSQSACHVNLLQQQHYQLFHRMADDFQLYIDYRSGLIDQAHYQVQVKKMSVIDKKTLQYYEHNYVNQRNLYRGRLLADLVVARYYFHNETLNKLIDCFAVWDQKHIHDGINDSSMPSRMDYITWRNKIMKTTWQLINSKKSVNQ